MSSFIYDMNISTINTNTLNSNTILPGGITIDKSPKPTENIDIPTKPSHKYALTETNFDPFRNSPPNVFINNLKARMSAYYASKK